MLSFDEFFGKKPKIIFISSFTFQVFRSNVMNVSFAEEHGKQKAGIYYNIVKKAKMTSNHRTIKARLGIRNALNNRRNFAGKYGNFGNVKRGNNIQHRFMRGNMRMMHQ